MLFLAVKPIPLVSLVANPFTGNVDMVLNQEAIQTFGPLYPILLRQQLENAVKVAENMERSVQPK